VRLLFALLVLSKLSLALPIEGLKDLNGNPASLDHQKEKELVIFWATWCPDCKNKLSGKLPEINGSADVAVITINTDSSQSRAKHFVEKMNLKLPVFRDDSKDLRKTLKVFSVPHWAVYKKENAKWRLVDSAPAFEMDRIEKALKG